MIGNFTGIDSGAAYYKKFCTPVAESTNPTNETVDSNSDPFLGYPDPVNQDSKKKLAGYFLTSTGFEDVAVLSILSFTGEPANSSRELANFLESCKEAKKTKLVVDVSNNGGGIIFVGYNFFKQVSFVISLFDCLPHWC